MKSIEVVAAVIRNENRVLATQRGYGAYKDWWEFPGGKIEAGEMPEEALTREIREELKSEILVGECIDTVEYDYPEFHLVMKCYWAEIVRGEPVLLEHEAIRWLGCNDLNEVNWLPADRILLEPIRRELSKGGVL